MPGKSAGLVRTAFVVNPDLRAMPPDRYGRDDGYTLPRLGLAKRWAELGLQTVHCADQNETSHRMAVASSSGRHHPIGACRGSHQGL